jgi:(2Fe-2S) ferredoxin
VLAALQRALATSAALCGEAAATGCGCLGPCFDGPNMVVYPEGVWYAGVTPEDIPDVVRDHLIGGVPVARLRYHWPDDDLDDNGDSDDDDDDDRR